jgi:flagellar biosynthesis/type III secretory pathway M-ring protein FliF/YscJ
MSLKDSFNGDSCKDFLNRYRMIIKTNAVKAAERLKSQITDFRIEKLSRLSRNIKIGIGAGALGVVVICTALFLNMGPNVYQLTIAGKDAGYLPDTEMVTQAIDEIKVDLSKDAGGIEIAVDDKAIACESTDLSARKVKWKPSFQASRRKRWRK